MREGVPVFILALISLAGRVPSTEDLAYASMTKPRAFQYDGKKYVAQYTERYVDGMNSEGMRVGRMLAVVALSRSDGTQFVESDADRKEAQVVAVAYCRTRNLVVEDEARSDAYFAPASEDDRADWNFRDLCFQPTTDDQVAG
jgi:hypothetical protein